MEPIRQTRQVMNPSELTTSQRDRPTSLWTVAMLVAVVASCSAPVTRSNGPTKSAATSPAAALPDTQDVWLRRFERLVRKGDDSKALDALARARRAGANPADVSAYESVALWRTGRIKKAAAIDQRIAVTAAAGDRDALREVERLAAFHALTRRQPKLALALVGPLADGGCKTARTCDVAARIVVATADAARPTASRIDKYAPVGPPHARLAWQLDVVRDLAANSRWKVASATLDTLLARHAQDPAVWATAWFIARRRRGKRPRDAWVQRFEAAKLPIPVVRRVIGTRDVASDRLLVASLWQGVCARDKAQEEHFVAWVRALARNQARGSPDKPRKRLQEIARESSDRFKTRAGQRVLAEALLQARLPTLAAPLVDGPGVARQPLDLVLRAELLRQRGDARGARRMANEAFGAATNKAEVAWKLATIWRRTWLADAQKWQRRAKDAPGRARLASLREHALGEIERMRPAPGTERLVRDYARRLAEAAAAPKKVDVSHLQLRRWRDEFVYALGDRGTRRSAWHQAARSALEILSQSSFATLECHFVLARIAARSNRPAALLSAYRRAKRAADAAGRDIDDERLLRDVLPRASTHVLARWLRLSGLHEATDLALTWQVANRLLAGAYKSLGRRWLQRSLARMTGAAMWKSALPRRARGVMHRSAGRSPRISATQLERTARDGGADLVLEYLRTVDRRKPGGGRPPPSVTLKYGRAELIAWLSLGRPDRARKALDRILARSLRGTDQRRLLDLVYEANLCEVTFDLALKLVRTSQSSVYRRAIDRGLECARQRGDYPGAQRLMDVARRAQISRERHMQLGERLARHGFDELAVQVFDRVIDGRVTRHSMLRHYARALLDTGRVSQATGVLKRMIHQHRSRPHEYLMAARLLEKHGQDAAAATLLEEAVKRHGGHVEVRLSLILQRLRDVDIDGFDEHVRALMRLGPSTSHLARLLNGARQAGRLVELYSAVRGVLNPDRAVERFRLELAGVLGMRRQVAASVRSLRDRGRINTHHAIRWLREVGATRQARRMAEDVLAAARPSSGRRGRRERFRILREAMLSRRDPTSRTEALGIARLFVGRALDRGQAAALASSELDRLGFARDAAAVGKLAIASGDTDAQTLCRQGAIAWRAEQPERALKLWRRSVGRLLVQDGRRSDVARRVASACLVTNLQRAGQSALLIDLLERLLDTDKKDATTWRALLQAHLDAGDVPSAVATLRRAHQVAQAKHTRRYMVAAHRIRRLGGGPLLARWFAEGADMRADPVWVAFAIDVLAEQQPRLGATARRARERLEALARNLPSLRVQVALMWAGRGEPKRAAAALGPAPFVQVRGRLLSARYEAARATATVLIALYRSTASSATPGASIAGGLEEDRWQRVAKLVANWTRTLSLADTSLVAGELVTQGHPQLAQKLTAARKVPDGLVPSAVTLRQRMRVALTVGSDKEVLDAAGTYMAVADRLGQAKAPHERQRATLRQLALAGRPAAALVLAKAVAATGSPASHAIGVVRAGSVATLDANRFEELVRAYSPRVLTRMAAAGPVRSRRVALRAVDVAVAAGRVDLAQAWVAAIARRDDEPWRAWLALHRCGVRHAHPALAKLALNKASRHGAPEGVRRCPSLWLERRGTLAGCIAGRPVARLPVTELHDLALAAAMGVDAKGVPALLKAVAEMPPVRQMQWIGGLTLRGWALDGTGLHRGRQLVAELVRGVQPAARRDELINRALDDLAALGVSKPGIKLTGDLLARRPGDRYARNNAAYAVYLSGQDARRALRIGLPALGTRGGHEAHALLDTLASALHATGAHAHARTAQRWSLAASRPFGDGRHDPGGLSVDAGAETDAGLPLVRLAEFELQAGNLANARLLALLGLERERIAALAQMTAEEHADTGLPHAVLMVRGIPVTQRARLLDRAGLGDAGTPITIARARAVLRAVLRQSVPKPRGAALPPRK